ncbi:hypothetical protein DFH27DRAFT_607891 [Peziza echinospora]|nr:hypothetical protein DFH27DRAFT_607891 [Peziza echinospora]
MARSADFVPLGSKFGPQGHGSAEKVHLSVEVGDDYSSDDDGYLSPLEEAHCDEAPSLVPATWGGKRPAESQSTDNELLSDTTKRQKLTALALPKALTLPKSIWVEIFSQLPPNKLAQLRQTCKQFSKILSEQSIWRASRNTWLPDMPKPVFNLKEWQMLSLAKGEGCMICGSEMHIRAVYWAFRTRCCTQCFNQNMTKESSLPASFPRELLTALPFGYIDTTGQWVFNAHSQRQTPGLTKVYWNDDIKSIRLRYEEAKSMNADEEWLKGLESEGNENRADVIRMETYESKLLARAKGRPITSISKPLSHTGCGLSPSQHLNRGPLAKPNWNYSQQNVSLAQVHPQPSSHCLPLQAHVVKPGMMLHPYAASPLPTATAFLPQPHAGTNWQAAFAPVPSQTPLVQKPRATISRPERSISEVAEVRRARQLDIEQRCLKLNPPIYPNELHTMPAFKTTMLIAVQLTEKAWQHLLPKLLEQRSKPDAKEKPNDHRQVLSQAHAEAKKPVDGLQRELKEKKEFEWEESQRPVKEKLDHYALSIVDTWLLQNCQGSKAGMNRDLALRFAPAVLVQIRDKFYSEHPYTAGDPGHHVMLDPNSAEGAAALERPTSSRLLLENMKYVFDTKIKPLTDAHRKELFLCSGCDNNPKLYGFEGIIQHYAAKHTASMSLGSVIVHWKTDWPYVPPFLLNPPVTSPSVGRSLGHSQHPTFQLGQSGNNPPSFGSTRGKHLWPTYQTDASSSTLTGTGNSSGEFMNTDNGFTAFPLSHKSCTIKMPNQCTTQIIQQINVSSPANGPGRLKRNGAQLPLPMSPPQPPDAQLTQLEHLATMARESWFQLSGIKDLHNSVRIHYVIQKITRSFQAAFHPLMPQLTMFIDALREHNLMKPMRNANGLQCLACAINPSHSNISLSGAGSAGRVFTLIALTQHFETVHVVRNKSKVKMDWKTQMIKLPDNRTIGMLRDTIGMDEEKLRHLKEVFPLAFNLPLPTFKDGAFHKRKQSTSSAPANPPITTPSIRSGMNSPISQDGQFENMSHGLISPASEQSPAFAGTDQTSRLFTGPYLMKTEPQTDSKHIPSTPPQQHDQTSMTAAERFLATFLQEDLARDSAYSQRSPGSTTWRTSDPMKKEAAERRNSDMSSKSSSQDLAIDRRRSIEIKKEFTTYVPDSYFTYKTPPRDDDRYSPTTSASARHHATSPPPSFSNFKLSNTPAYRPVSPCDVDPEPPRRNLSDSRGRTHTRVHSNIPISASLENLHQDHYATPPYLEEVYYDREPLPPSVTQTYGYPVYHQRHHDQDRGLPTRLRIPSPPSNHRQNIEQQERRYYEGELPDDRYISQHKRKRSSSPARSRSPRKLDVFQYPAATEEYYRISPQTERIVTPDVYHAARYATETISKPISTIGASESGAVLKLSSRRLSGSRLEEGDEAMGGEYDDYGYGDADTRHRPTHHKVPLVLEETGVYEDEGEQRYWDIRRYREWNMTRRIYLPPSPLAPMPSQPLYSPLPPPPQKLSTIFTAPSGSETSRCAVRRITGA